MIQRIQSIWLLAAALVLLGLFIFPFVNYIDLVGLGKRIFVTGVFSSVNNESVQESSNVLLTIGSAFVAIFPLFIIFLFKNRKLQQVCVLASIVSVVLLAVWLYASANSSLSAISLSLKPSNIGVGFFLLPVAIILLVMALNGIKSDEKLIKSADRLR